MTDRPNTDRSGPEHTAAIVVAAGRGERAGGGIPKQWQPLLGRPVIDWTLDAFRASGAVGRVVVVVAEGEDRRPAPFPELNIVTGGATRAASVRAGLRALDGTPTTRVLIHDAARACVTAEIVRAVAAALSDHPAAAPGAPVTDTLWRSDPARPGLVAGVENRAGLTRAQTPQGFRLDAIVAAHAAGHDATDDVGLALAAGVPVTILPGDPDNLKITAPGDFARAERILRGRMGQTASHIRLGNGFDVHRFGPGDHVTLCGVRVPHTRALQGHSDADVGLHTITDAIYGALAEGDIGRHFPPSDPKWKGADSRIFLEHAVARAAERGFRIGNIDLTLICEEPKIGPHASAMSAAISAISGVEPDRISVKATTTERLGFPGRGEGIAALATVTLVSP